MNSAKKLRGGAFQNRYKITGVLTTRSPLHIGSGEELLSKDRGLPDPETTSDNGRKKKTGPATVSGVAVGLDEKPYIPGSTLRGNLRSWLYQVFLSLSTKENANAPAYDHDYEAMSKKPEFQKQDNQIRFMKEKASVLERLFGTPFAASKLEIWDASCATSAQVLQVPSSIKNNEDRPPFWHSQRMTFVTQSVAIDPETGAAADQKLYHFEVVPKGVSFKVTICGQNLDEEELGMLLFALEGFNSEIFPVTLGAMTARGFGQMRWKLDEIYRLDENNIQSWITDALSKKDAGYNALKSLKDQQKNLIKNFKNKFQQSLGVTS